ncbi:hypothetical protein EVC10_053 [Rhizobium phage RHph_Y25]|nr:hypothetical protein EVC10_053 [Rhizobium phage RHph_Y25]
MDCLPPCCRGHGFSHVGDAVKNAALIEQIDALLDLDARGALSPHGVGGLARQLLTVCKETLVTTCGGESDEEIVRYVSRFGGMCRDCADECGVCPHSGAPCNVDQRRAVIRKTIEAHRYGIEHRFIPNIFGGAA